jgi:hypothetical protein
VRLNLLPLALALAAACPPLMAQSTPSANSQPLPQTTVNPRANATVRYRDRGKLLPPKPFSVVAVGGGVSAMGVNMQAAVNVNRFINLRGVGNYFNYTVNSISTNGFNASGKFNFATAGASVDFYPFPSHGFRISPGALFLNNNTVTANVVASGGTSFTLNNDTYYSSASNPVTGVAGLKLNGNNPAFTATVGWGNMIPRYGGRHWSFPFEIGAAFIGAPPVSLALTSGQVCTNSQGTVGCQNVSSDPMLNADIQAEVVKLKNDVNPFQYYPILSFGVAYNFHIRH